MDIEALKSLFSDFDFANFIPDLQSVMGWVETLTRIAVMAGPVLLLGFGMLFLLAPPKEANHGLGYRFWWGMASLDAWQFTQHLAGMVWMVLGLTLTVVMSLICNGFRGMDPEAMLWKAMKCIGWELGLAAAACLAIDIAVVCVFDKRGFRRKEKE